jgi:uncharacterized protein YidB (DUF937 family)
MAGFDMGSLLNKVMGGDGQQAQDGSPGSPRQSGTGGPMSGEMMGKLAPMLTGLLSGGGMAKLLSRLHRGGLGDQAKSWVATDQPNMPVSGDLLNQALGPETMAHIAAKLGLNKAQAADTMARALPSVIDAMTPDGKVPDSGAADPQNMQNMQNAQNRMAAADPAGAGTGAKRSVKPAAGFESGS